MRLAVVGSDAYKWLLAFHILLAVVWVGSNTAPDLRHPRFARRP